MHGFFWSVAATVTSAIIVGVAGWTYKRRRQLIESLTKPPPKTKEELEIQAIAEKSERFMRKLKNKESLKKAFDLK